MKSYPILDRIVNGTAYFEVKDDEARLEVLAQQDVLLDWLKSEHPGIEIDRIDTFIGGK